jgi:ABC-type glycerol-3-phosphate transport system substrate-binding protein
MLQAQEIILREIENQVGGTAEATATSSERMTIAFGMVQEKIGNVLMPAFDSLAEWFVEILPDIERFGDGLVGALDDPKVQKAISDMQTSLGNLGITIGTLFGSTETDEAKGFMNFWIGLSGIIQFLATSLDSLLAPINAAFGNTQPMENYLDRLFGLIPGYSEYSGFMQRRDAITPAPGPLPPLSITNNISVKTDATATEIATAVNKAVKVTGTNIFRQ